MAKASIKPANVDKYSGLNLLEIEAIINDLTHQQKISPSPHITQDLAAARCALQQHQRRLKAKVMTFEQTNNRYLLFFNSTHNYVKVVGHSALFFAVTIADRIHWRYSLKLDTDRYYISEDGVISFRSLENVAVRLAKINILPDPTIGDDELHYFKLARVYTDEQIATLRDHAQQDLKRIMTLILPTSPIPSLYDAIMQTGQLVYYQFKHSSDNLARDTIGKQMINATYTLATEYLKYSRARNRDNKQNLVNIIETSREIRYGIAYASKLHILHHREVCKILEQLISIERIAAKAYLRQDQQDNPT